VSVVCDVVAPNQRVKRFGSALKRLSDVECATVSIYNIIYRASDPTPTQLAEASDDNLFSNVLTNNNHVLKPLLPDKSNHQYNLRHRRHTLTLSIKTDARNFVVRQLFRDTY